MSTVATAKSPESYEQIIDKALFDGRAMASFPSDRSQWNEDQEQLKEKFGEVMDEITLAIGALKEQLPELQVMPEITATTHDPFTRKPFRLVSYLFILGKHYCSAKIVAKPDENITDHEIILSSSGIAADRHAWYRKTESGYEIRFTQKSGVWRREFPAAHIIQFAAKELNRLKFALD